MAVARELWFVRTSTSSGRPSARPPALLRRAARAACLRLEPGVPAAVLAAARAREPARRAGPSRQSGCLGARLGRRGGDTRALAGAGLLDERLGLRAVAVALGLDGLALERPVLPEEVLDLVPVRGRDVVDVAHRRPLRVLQRHADDLFVRTLLVGH